jgi:putative transposase
MNLKHFDHDNRARFVTFCTHQRIPVLTNNRFRRIFIDVVERVRRDTGFRLLAYVLMPEHVHLVIVPPESAELGPLGGEIKRISSLQIHESMDNAKGHLVTRLTVIRDGAKKFTLWQRRCYDHNCRTVESVWEKVNYCHNNPVVRRLVESPEDYRWSSYMAYLGREDAILAIDFGV